jgi:hypothetical protein
MHRSAANGIGAIAKSSGPFIGAIAGEAMEVGARGLCILCIVLGASRWCPSWRTSRLPLVADHALVVAAACTRNSRRCTALPAPRRRCSPVSWSRC